MSNNPDDVLGGTTHDEGDAKDAKALDDELKKIQSSNAIELAEAINAIQFATPPSYPPPNYMFDMFATLYRQLHRH